MRELAGQQRLHRAPFALRRRSHLEADDGEPQRGVADQRDDVERGAVRGDPAAIPVEVGEDLFRAGLAEQRTEVARQWAARGVGRRIE